MKLLKTFLIFALCAAAARAEENPAKELPRFVRPPKLANNSALCASYLQVAPAFGIQHVPGEGYESQVRQLLENFKKAEFGAYQRHPDYRLRSVLGRQSDPRSYHKVLARIDGILGDNQAQKKVFLVLRGRERIEEFQHQIWLQQHLLRLRLSAEDQIYKHIVFTALVVPFPANTAHLFQHLNPVAWALGLYNFYFVANTLALPSRYSLDYGRHMRQFQAADHEWIYSSTAYAVSAEVASSKAQDRDVATSVQALANDHTTLFSRFIADLIHVFTLPVWLDRMRDLPNHRRAYVALDHLQMLDEETQEPVMILAVRLYSKKPTNPVTEKATEKAGFWARALSPGT